MKSNMNQNAADSLIWLNMRMSFGILMEASQKQPEQSSATVLTLHMLQTIKLNQ